MIEAVDIPQMNHWGNLNDNHQIHTATTHTLKHKSIKETESLTSLIDEKCKFQKCIQCLLSYVTAQQEMVKTLSFYYNHN